MKDNITNVVKAIIPYEALLTLIRFIWRKETLSVIFTILFPMIIVYVISYMFLGVMSFVFWKFPAHIPIPFYHGLAGLILDRVLIVIGFVLLFMSDGHDY